MGKTLSSTHRACGMHESLILRSLLRPSPLGLGIGVSTRGHKARAAASSRHAAHLRDARGQQDVSVDGLAGGKDPPPRFSQERNEPTYDTGGTGTLTSEVIAYYYLFD